MRFMLTSARSLALALLSTALIAAASPLLGVTTSTDSTAACPRYIVIQTRGTGEEQGPSYGFIWMNGLTLSIAAGGSQYFTVYPAAADQNSTMASDDIVARISQFVADDPTVCILLQGYSQGAAATTVALNQLNGTSADAVKAVYMIGNPLHKPGLACNVDPTGANKTLSAMGLQRRLDVKKALAVPPAFVDRTLDVCIPGDGICDSDNGVGYGAEGQHLTYGEDINTQTMGFIFFNSIVLRNKYIRVVTDFGVSTR